MTILYQKIASRLPTKGQIAPVFSLIIFIAFSWMLYHIFRQTTSWLYYMGMLDVMVVYAYAFSFTLVESASILLLLLVFCLVSPARFFKDKFVAQGTLQVLVVSGITYGLRNSIELIPKQDIQTMAAIPGLFLVVMIISILLFSLILDRLQFLSRLLNAIADRMIIFAYIYVPLGLVGAIVVILRNLF
ncbi:MAG: hypothetical protein AB1894_19605 [Chloroflexota bacterium]